MANLYITEQGAILCKTGDRLIVRKENDVLLDVPCNKIESVMIFGNVQFTTQAIHELFEHGIEMAILSRTGRLIGQITSPSTKNIELRIEQFKKYWDIEFRLNLSKIILRVKITNCLNVIRSFSYNHPQIDFSGETNEMKKFFDSIVTGIDINSLMGIEGIIAKVYFTAFGKMILKEFTFNGRKKHPSTDPVNALLSFGYTLVFNEIMSLLDGLGFDPYLGYFHSAEYGRASLASDLQEEFRAVIDRFTLYLINYGIFKKDDFYVNPKAEGMYLKRESMKRYFEEYERFFANEFKHPETSENTTFRKCFRIQAEKLANYIKGGSAYTPFLLQV